MKNLIYAMMEEKKSHTIFVTLKCSTNNITFRFLLPTVIAMVVNIHIFRKLLLF